MIWTLISLVMVFIGCTQGNNILLVTSGLFAIAGAVGVGSGIIRDAIKLLVKKPEEN